MNIIIINNYESAHAQLMPTFLCSCPRSVSVRVSVRVLSFTCRLSVWLFVVLACCSDDLPQLTPVSALCVLSVRTRESKLGTDPT